LPAPEDQRALALLLAELWGPAGRSAEGLAALDHVAWPPRQPSAARAHELRGELLADLGEIDQALAEYRRSLEDVTQLRATLEIRLRTSLGRRALVYLRDFDQARNEVAQARFDLEVLRGEIEDYAGNYAGAHTHYTAALALAGADHHRLAKLHEVLGILEARHLRLAAAVEHLKASESHYTATGNLVCAVGVTNTNLSYANLLARRYTEAIPPAQTALAFFSELNHPYWLALNEANLAEAYFYLGEVGKAEEYAQRGLRREEEVVRPYCLYVLAHVRRAQGRLGEAERFGKEAITAGEELHDPWALGPAWRALVETYYAAGRWEDAQNALAQVVQIDHRLGIAAEVELVQASASS
jgi:tetratricopeptide (TPR) repeat protein